MFQRLARVADQIAETVEYGARVMDELWTHLPSAAAHAARRRRLAKAMAAAAVASRNLEVPSEAVRRLIVESRVRRS